MSSDLGITLLIWILELIFFLSICFYGYKKYKFKDKKTLSVMFVFFLLLWMSMKVAFEYQYLLIQDLENSGENITNNMILWVALSYTLTIVLLRYPMTRLGSKWHKKSIILTIALFFIALTSGLMTGFLWIENVKALNIVFIFSSISLGVIYGSFTSMATMMANNDEMKNPFFTMTLLVFAMFGAEVLITPIKNITISSVENSSDWETYKLLYLTSTVFAVSALVGIIYIWKKEHYPSYEEERKQIKKKTLKQFGLRKDKEKEINFLGKNVKMLTTTHVWWKTLLPLAVFGFIVLFIYELMGANQFSALILSDLFVDTSYSQTVENQLITQLASLFSLFIFIGVAISTFYLIPNVGFKNTLRTGFLFIIIYAIISGLNMVDDNLQSPILMFILYSLLGLGFGMTYYVILGYVLLLDITNPIQKKISGLGLWLFITGFAYLIAEVIFVGVVVSDSGTINDNRLGLIMFSSAAIVFVLYIALAFFERKQKDSIYKQAKRKIHRDKKAII